MPGNKPFTLFCIFGQNLQAMLKKFNIFIPTFKNCWWMVFLFIIPGSILAGGMGFFKEIEILSKLGGYLVVFIPLLLYFIYKSNKLILEEASTGVINERIRINQPDFGKMNGIIFFLIIALASFAITVLIDPLTRLMPSPDWFNKIMLNEMGGNKIISVLTVAVCAPLCEEFVCRGMMCRGMLRHNSPAWAILWSAFFFAFIHLNPWQAVPAFILGCFYGWVYYKTRCLWATIFLHALNNGTSLAITYIFPELPMDASLKDVIANPDTYMVVYAIAIGIIALAFFLINKYIPKIKNGNDKETTIPAEV